MESQATQSSEKKESGLGWGTIFAGIAVIGAVIGAVTGLSHLNEAPIPQISDNSIDSVFEMKKETWTHEQWIDKGKVAANNVGGAINGVLEGADNLRKSGANNIAGLGSTILGNGSIDDARNAIASTFVELDKDIMSSKEVQDFIAGDKRAIFYGDDGGMLLKKGGDVLYASGDKLKSVDAEVLGGLIPNGKQLIEGFNPNAFREVQGAGAEAAKVKSEAEQMLLKKAISGGTIASILGLGLKAAENNHEAKIASPVNEASNNIVPFHPSTRIDSQGTQLLGLAASAKSVNMALAGM